LGYFALDILPFGAWLLVFLVLGFFGAWLFGYLDPGCLDLGSWTLDLGCLDPGCLALGLGV
jgi:hypothetical protein